MEKIPKGEVGEGFDEALDTKITIKELKSCIKKLKNGKAPGNDEISNEFLKELSEEWINVLIEFLKQNIR